MTLNMDYDGTMRRITFNTDDALDKVVNSFKENHFIDEKSMDIHFDVQRESYSNVLSVKIIINDLYYFDGQELCIDCVEQRLERVEYCG